MRRHTRTGRLLAAGLAVAVAWGATAAPASVVAQDAAETSLVDCAAESEPNDLPEQAVSLTDEFCRSGTLLEQEDQDLYLWEVAPGDGLTDWVVTVRGVPATITSTHFITIASSPGAVPFETGGEPARADSDAHLGSPPMRTTIRLAPGRYLLGISRGAPGFNQALTDDVSYEIQIERTGELPPAGDVEPNDDATIATPVSDTFALTGDLQATNDHYRWTVTDAGAASPQRLEAQTAVGAPLTLEVYDAAGQPVVVAYAGPGGTATLHDLGLAPGDYDVVLSPGAGQTQPYSLTASAITEPGVDPEPNDTPERALSIDAATMTVSGRLATDLDVDAYAIEIDEALAANLVDIGMSWSEGLDRSLCLFTETGTRIGCLQGFPSVAFAGLLLPAGRYRLDVSGSGSLDDRYRLSVTPGAPLPPAGDVEPNDDAATASPVTGAFAVSGDLTGSVPGTGDVFAWTVSEPDAARSWRLELSATPGIGGHLGLYGPDGSALASSQTSPEGTARIFDLRLPAGTYTAWITQSGSASPGYVLRSVEETAPDIDPEPNDGALRAVPLDRATLAARGRIATPTDVDRYSFVVDEGLAANLIDLRLAWPSDREYQLCLSTGSGSQIQCRTGRDGLDLADLRLAPADYQLEVSGQADSDSRYDVSVTSGLAPALDREVEPNDLATAPTDWDPGLVMRGRSEDGDVDTYRVHVEGVPEVWRLDVTGTGLRSPFWTQPDGTRVGVATVADDRTTALIEDLYLVAGDHLLTVDAGGEYDLALTSLGPPDLAAEREPNDDSDRAAPIEEGGERTARLPVAEDVDVYRFSLSAPEHIVITVTPPADGAIDLEVASAGTSLAQVASPGTGQPTVFDGQLPPGDHQAWLRTSAPSAGSYAIRLDRADPFALSDVAALPATLDLIADEEEVAAFWRDGQRVEAALRVANTGSDDLALHLDAATSDHAWTVQLHQEVAVEPAATVDVPLTILVPADAWLGIPVRVTVRAADAGGAEGTAFVEITPRQGIAPVAPEQVWTVPAELLGGLDVASAALGAVPIGSHFHEADIHDGVSIAGLGLSDSIQNGPLTLGVDLAGDDLVPVAGTILDPLTGDSPFAFRPRAITLLLSDDGVTYDEVLATELSPRTVNQAFVLDAPVPARFAQLRIDSTWGETPASVYLGEWKVVAEPGFAPTTATDLNIADPVRGGHVVWSEPASQYVFYELLPEADTPPRTIWLDPGKAATWVIGFADDRAAQVTGLEWEDSVGSVPDYHFSSADVAVSVGSPLGPWEDVGEWELQRADDGAVADLELSEPVWARFVRLTLPGPSEAANYREQPSVVRVIERPTDETYRSILGEWGQSSPKGIYEQLVPPRSVAAATDDPDVGDIRDQAATLAAEEIAAGSVARSRDEDWYAVKVPDGQDTLRIDLREELEGNVRLRLQDAAGVDIDLDPSRTAEPGVTTWTAIVEPGADYWLEVVQPVLSVVVTFDTSASIAPWFPKLRAAVRAFSEDVTPGQEVVQVIPFGEGELLESWSDQPYLIAGAMDAWTSPAGSSALADSIMRAAAMLSEREGMRAILAMGDAVGGGFEILGGVPTQSLATARPVIFPVHLGGTDDPYVSTGIMHDLAATNGGFYQYGTSQAALERAFDRMATWLRRPAGYELSYETSFVDYPPGSLSVVPAEGATVPLGGGISVELVLDTSGSMNKKLAGVTRMAVARETLIRLVDETLPEGLPVALRTFKAGDGSCKTVLPVPFGPLERAAMDRVIADLPLHHKTRTPLGATLHAVGDDLVSREGPKIVVFVTDGKETCKGDPAAEVARLVELGIDVALNIVGFALEDPALKADMEAWATAGGGVFFDAQDQDSLLAGIAAALQAPFRVYDASGTLVGSGVVGGAGLELPTGSYRVEVLSEPPVTFEAVEVSPGEGVVLEVAPEGS